MSNLFDLVEPPLHGVFLFALKFLVCVYIPGAAWRWILRGSRPAGPGRGACWLIAAAESILLGLIFCLLSVLTLARLGAFNRTAGWGAIAVVSLAGLALGWARRGKGLGEVLADSLPGLAAAGLGAALVLGLPQRGEWVLGGWDPGVNVNEGVCVGRLGTLSPEAAPAYREMGSGALKLFTRRLSGMDEAFPGIPVDLATGRFRFYFYPMTPVAVAVLHRCGGLRAAVRVNEFLGLLAVLMFAALLRAGGYGTVRSLLTCAVFAAQPIFLYHLHTPASEMLELLLVCALGFCLVRREESWAFSIAAALLVLTAVLNRISFELFGALLVVAVAATDLDRPDRRRVAGEHALLALGLAAGAVFYGSLSPVSIAKIGVAMVRIYAVGAAAVAAALALDLASFHRPLREHALRAASGRSGYVLLALTAVLLGISAVTSGYLGRAVVNARNLLPFVGWPVTLLAWIGLGGLLVPARGRKDPRTISGLIVFLLVVFAIVLRYRHAAALYPWATKRYLLPVVPLAALLAGTTLWRIWSARGGRAWSRVLAIGLLVASLLPRWPWIRDAWQKTEYDGVSRTLSDIAQHVDAEDVVVADHFWWGAPLTFVYGKQVLNGERIWAVGEGGAERAAVDALRRLRSAGRRVWFVTSTEMGMEIFGVDVKGADLRWSSGPVQFREIVQQKRPRGFLTRERVAEFRLYAWDEPSGGEKKSAPD